MCSGWQTALSSWTHRSGTSMNVLHQQQIEIFRKKVFVRAKLPTEEGSLLIAESWIYGPGHMSNIRWVVNLCVMLGRGSCGIDLIHKCFPWDFSNMRSMKKIKIKYQNEHLMSKQNASQTRCDVKVWAQPDSCGCRTSLWLIFWQHQCENSSSSLQNTSNEAPVISCTLRLPTIRQTLKEGERSSGEAAGDTHSLSSEETQEGRT